MVILYLFLGHFIADFLLQPHSLVVWKNKSWHGVLIHVIIHFLVTSLLLYWYLGHEFAFFIALCVSFLHFWIDLLKASHQKTGRHPVLVYWLDQAFHYLSILLVGLLFLNRVPASVLNSSDWLNNLYRSPFLLVYFSGAIFITYAVEYSLYRYKQNQGAKTPAINSRQMIKRLFLYSLIFLGLAFATPLAGYNWL